MVVPFLNKAEGVFENVKHGQVINSPSSPRISSNQHKRTMNYGSLDPSHWSRRACNSSPKGLPRKQSSVSTLESSERQAEVCGHTHQCSTTKALLKIKSPESVHRPQTVDLMAWLSLRFIHNAFLISIASGMTTQYIIVRIVYRKAWVITTHINPWMPGAVQGQHETNPLSGIKWQYKSTQRRLQSILLFFTGLNLLNQMIIMSGYWYKTGSSVCHQKSIDDVKWYSRSTRNTDLIILLIWIYIKDIGCKKVSRPPFNFYCNSGLDIHDDTAAIWLHVKLGESLKMWLYYTQRPMVKHLIVG